MTKLRLLRSGCVCIAVLGLAVRGGGVIAQDGRAQADEVLAVLHQGTEAFVKKDMAFLARVFHEDFVLGHASGNLQSRDAVLKDVANPQRVWESWRLTEPDVHVYGSTAVVRCISDVLNGAPGKAVRGYTRALWVLLKGPQGWQIVTAQRVRIDPPVP